ncbi:MAG TPA: flavodoxin domain-containing protein [Coriobacteriia bacterium]|nr:flavodoxin domain-containing protein [Coriobacteriia bacterium]
MKALVVYGTKSGCTAGIAEKIGETLSARGFIVRVAPAQEAGDASDYEAVIVGSGVRAGAWHESTRTWVTNNAEALKEIPVAFYTCGLMITDSEKSDQVRGYTDALIEATGVRPVDIGLFAGWNEPKEFSFLERSVMKMMKAPVGDFRDWNVVTAWAEKIAPQLTAS